MEPRKEEEEEKPVDKLNEAAMAALAAVQAV